MGKGCLILEKKAMFPYIFCMMLSIFLSLLGLLLVFIEFFLPGGLIALIGGLLLVAGMCMFSLLDVALLYKIFYFIGTAGGAALACQCALWIIKNRSKDALYLSNEQKALPQSFIEENLVGVVGIVSSDLKPSGHITIEGKRFQAVSEGEYIKKGASITIIEARSNYFIVKENV